MVGASALPLDGRWTVLGRTVLPRCCRSSASEVPSFSTTPTYLYPRGTASSVDQALSVLAGLGVYVADDGLPDVVRRPGARPAGLIMLLRGPALAGRAWLGSVLGLAVWVSVGARGSANPNPNPKTL